MSTPLSFNASWYLSQNPDVAAAIEAGAPFNAFEHFTLYGRAENRSASPVFDAQEYLRNNPDVAEAVAQGLITAWDHFELFGGAEGRSPTPLFNEAFYLQQNPDVAAAIEQGIISSAAQHFALFGQSEPRAINPAINLGQYINANPDIGQAAANGLINVFDHLLQYGVNEGRDLGNGVSLGDFSSDPGFTQALGGGNPMQALIRVETVAPFLPTFERPAGWTPPANTPIPVDFVPPADSGIKLVIPPEVVVPDDVELPEDTFEPVTPPAPEPGTGGGGGTTPIFTVTEEEGVITFGGTATGNITMTVDDDGVATFTRAGVVAADTAELSEATPSEIRLTDTQQLVAEGTELSGLNIHFIGTGTVDIRNVDIWGPEATDDGAPYSVTPAGASTDLSKIILPYPDHAEDDTATILLDGSIANFIKLSWIYFDQLYYKDWPNTYDDYQLTIAKANLSLMYVEHLADNDPFTSPAKLTVNEATGDITRSQMLHDNLLGELTRGSLNDRLGADDRADDLAFYTEAAGDFFYRPYYDGNVGKKASLAATILWDLDHDIARTSEETNSVNDNIFIINKSSSTATIIETDLKDAVVVAGNGDAVLVGPNITNQGINLTSNKDLIILGTDLPNNAPSTIDANGFVYALWASGDGFTGTVTIDGLTVVAGSEGGIGQFMSASAGQFHVLNNVITTSELSYQAHGNSIQISGEGSTVIGNTVDVTEYTTANDSWSTSGITVVKDASSAIIANNTVTGPAEISDGNSIIGIAADGKYSDDAGLMNIQITGNTLTNTTSGISLSDKVEAEVTGNTLSNNAVGISLGTTSGSWLDELNITIDGNTFSGNGKAISINDFDSGGQITIQDNIFTSTADMEGAIWLNSSGAYLAGSVIEIDLEQFSTAAGKLADNVIYTGTKESDAIHDNIIFGTLTEGQVTVTWNGGAFTNLEVKLTGAADFALSEIQDFFGGTLVPA